MKKLLSASVLSIALSSSIAVADTKMPFTKGEGDFNWKSLADFAAANSLKGEKLTIAGPWLAPESDRFQGLITYFDEATGANTSYTGSDSFEQQIVIDAEAGSAPNLAVFPQPGLAATLASRGLMTPLAKGSDEWIKDNYAAGMSWVDLGTYPDKSGADQTYGLFFNVNVKSLVWYSPENFEDAGYEVPNSMEELKALTKKIVADGGKPWCIGLGSGAATGWPATDWVEDLMLRTQTPEVYDQWVKNEIPFNDAKVLEAIEDFGWFAKNDDYVQGGAGAVASTDFRDSPKPLFSTPPGCYMHRQASFIPAFFPKDTKVGEDADFFYFPAYEKKDLGKPVLGGGTLVGITKESKAAHAFIEFLKTPFAHEIMMAQKGFLTPHKGVNVKTYANDALRGQGKILLNATTFRFDGSDLMPGAVGAGTFWTGMVDYVGGKSSKEVADVIEASFKATKK